LFKEESKQSSQKDNNGGEFSEQLKKLRLIWLKGAFLIQRKEMDKTIVKYFNGLDQNQLDYV